ncbi:hypothetical protein [Microbacterium sp. K5D]|uniref:hypothetical protein n=1 Tax=Microbacterium sp. K5D TaxID=2305436 RepID=UPI00109CD260|nr:hypothetical protein [Microbacterium sp. K5D]
MADDFSELAELAADLSTVPPEANRNIKKALEVTARSVKEDWRQGAEVGRGDGYSERYASSIFYDIKYPLNGIEAEIGPELGRAGASAGFLEDAPGGVQAAPQHAGRDALEANEADFVRGLEIAITQAVIDKVEG